MSLPSIEALTAGKRFSASVAALTKNDMKPRRTPLWDFSNRSLYFERSAMTSVMSTSLKVVSIAMFDWASTRRSATLASRRVIGTRFSARSPPGETGAAAGGAGGGGARGGGSRSSGRGARDCGTQAAQQFAGQHGFAFILDDFGEYAVGFGEYFQHHLVGLDVDDQVIALDRIARLLVPSSHGAVGNRFREGWGFDLDSHALCFLKFGFIVEAAARAAA